MSFRGNCLQMFCLVLFSGRIEYRKYAVLISEWLESIFLIDDNQFEKKFLNVYLNETILTVDTVTG